jgi:hypothetical protein
MHHIQGVANQKTLTNKKMDEIINKLETFMFMMHFVKTIIVKMDYKIS